MLSAYELLVAERKSLVNERDLDFIVFYYDVHVHIVIMLYDLLGTSTVKPCMCM